MEREKVKTLCTHVQLDSQESLIDIRKKKLN